MWSFFHGWRRKAGVVSLVLACALAALWLRSLAIEDAMLIDTDYFGSIAIDVGIAGVSTRPNLLTIWKYDPPISEELVGADGQSEMFEMHEISPLCEIPFWPIVIPLTLLSAYLILRKPRKAKSSDQPAISDLISN